MISLISLVVNIWLLLLYFNAFYFHYFSEVGTAEAVLLHRPKPQQQTITSLLFSPSSDHDQLSPSPPSNKVLDVPHICLSDQPGVKGHQELPLTLSEETSSRKPKEEGRGGEVIFKIQQ